MTSGWLTFFLVWTSFWLGTGFGRWSMRGESE
jgi:hypothetical protein